MDQNTIFLDHVPVEFDLEAISRKLRVRPDQTKMLDRLKRLAEEAARVARPKAAARLCGLTLLDEDHVRVGDVAFTSPLLRQNMAELRRAFPYLATEGREMADWSLGLESSLDRMFACGLREAAVKRAETLLEQTLVEQFGLKQVSSMNPGSLKVWPLTEQTPLFELLAPLPEKLDVSLLPTLMMNPEYSVSGIFFQTDTKYYNCQLCPMENCPNRKAPSTVMGQAGAGA